MIRYAEISQIGAFTALSNTWDDYLAIDPSRCTGGGDSDNRLDVEDAPGDDGALIIGDAFDGQHVITIAGDLVVTSNGLGSEGGYMVAIETLFNSLKSAVDAAKTGPIDLVHPGGTLKVRKYGRVEDSWPSFWVCSVTFSVIVDVFA